MPDPHHIQATTQFAHVTQLRRTMWRCSPRTLPWHWLISVSLHCFLPIWKQVLSMSWYEAALIIIPKSSAWHHTPAPPRQSTGRPTESERLIGHCFATLLKDVRGPVDEVEERKHQRKRNARDDVYSLWACREPVGKTSVKNKLPSCWYSPWATRSRVLRLFPATLMRIT